MNFDPDLTYNLGRLATGAAVAYGLSGGAGVAYELARQNSTDIDVEQNLETYKKLAEKDLEDQKATNTALALFDLGRKEVLENEIGIESMYGQRAEPRRSQSRALAYFDELPYEIDQ